MKNVYSLVSIYFYLLSASVYSAPVENEPSIAVEDPSGIVGGEPVGSSAKYPWMVSLQRSPVGPGKAFCGGSLIAPNVVMTAARQFNLEYSDIRLHFHLGTSKFICGHFQTL